MIEQVHTNFFHTNVNNIWHDYGVLCMCGSENWILTQVDIEKEDECDQICRWTVNIGHIYVYSDSVQ